MAITVAGIILTTILSCYLIIEMITAVWGVSEVWNHLPSYTHSLFIVIPKVVSFLKFSGTPVQIYYLLILIGVLSSAVYLLAVSYRPIKEEGTKGLKKTPLYEVMTLFAALYFVEIIYIMIMNAAGVETSSPFDEENWEMMFTLLNASIYEEIICRILYLGLPMAVLAVIMKKDTKLTKYLFGGFGMSKLALVFIIFSGGIFAMAHLGGWGWWKIFPTFLFGVISGYIFCKYGVYATVSMHFLTDYLSASSWLGDPFSAMILALAVLASTFGGIPFVGVYTKRAYLWLKEEFTKKSSEETGKDSL